MAVKAKFVRISRYKYPAILELLASGYATVEDAMNLTAEKLAKFIRTEGASRLRSRHAIQGAAL